MGDSNRNFGERSGYWNMELILVYPLIANYSYGWEMLGTDINPKSLENAQKF